MGPFGVIGAITPCTNRVKQFYCNTIGMFAAGNTAVFNPHPAAIKTSIYAINLVNEASVEAGGPDNIACTVEHPTLETSNIMMKHPQSSLSLRQADRALLPPSFPQEEEESERAQATRRQSWMRRQTSEKRLRIL